MKKSAWVFPVLLPLLFSASAAQAKVLELYGLVQGGGSYGRGVAGGQKDNDFFQGAAGGAYGVLLGAELLWLDGWIQHAQFHDGKELTGTWTQFMAGMDWDFPVDEVSPRHKHRAYGEIGIAIGYGVGTGQQVDPPLDASELTDKGFLGQISFGAEYRFNPLVAVGFSVPIQYGYLFKTVEGAASNDETTHYHSVHATPMVHIRAHWEVF